MCFFSGAINASDTLIIKNPVYNSSFEKANFTRFIDTGNVDFLTLAFSLDSTVTASKAMEYKTIVDNYINDNKSRILSISNNKRQIKEIFKLSHNKFFTKYDLNATQCELFNSGKYNCVTGTLFYSYVLDQLGIPFTIKEDPTHAYLLAYPNEFSIPIESTDPQMEILIPNSKFKNEYINYLVEVKVVTQSEVAELGIEKIFNANFYSKKDIKPIELVGLLYYNSAVDYINKEDFKKSVHQFEKAYMLYPSDRISYPLIVSLINIVQENKFTDVKDITYLSKLASYSKTNTIKDYLIEKFKNITYENIVRTKNEELYDSIFYTIYSQFSDATINKEIADIYYVQRAHSYFVNNQLDKGWELVLAGYKNNPENRDIIGLMHNFFIEKGKFLLGSDDFESFYFNHINEYPVLTKNRTILSMGSAYFLQKIQTNFFYDNKKEGEEFMGKFEKFMENYNFVPEGYLLGPAYGEAASYYFRKRDLKSCKLILDKGLKISPNNEILTRKYKINFPDQFNQ